tara:strand:+ start:4039 stop:4263 length:225 start_codon:yes stop_codon:yes gene_type:complete
MSKKIDMVNTPPHYTMGSIECIDAIKEALGPEGFKSWCQGNAMKYLWRYKHKGSGIQDLEKSIFYINRIIQQLK